MKNNIPTILEQKSWTRYKLWQELGGGSSARDSVYRLGHPKARTAPIPIRTRWGTLRAIATALNVSMDDLEHKD